MHSVLIPSRPHDRAESLARVTLASATHRPSMTSPSASAQSDAKKSAGATRALARVAAVCGGAADGARRRLHLTKKSDIESETHDGDGVEATAAPFGVMRPQSCKAKGRRLQQHVVQQLLRTFPELEADDVRSVSMGCSGEDIVLSPRARQLLPYAFECKNQEKLNLWSSIDQCEANAGANHPVLVFKRNREKTRVVLSLQHFLALIRRGDASSETLRASVARMRAELDLIEQSMQASGNEGGAASLSAPSDDDDSAQM